MPRELPLLLFALVCLAVFLAQHRATRRLERQDPGRFPPVPLPATDWSTPASGRHRRGSAPDTWAACHTTSCAHLTRPHAHTPAGLECLVCGHVISGGPMDEDHTEYADAVDYPTREEEKAAEIALDVADEERRAAEAAGAGPEDEGECFAELIDGSWTDCGCEDCTERETREDELL